MTISKRQHLLQTAETLFAKEGFKGLAMDRLIAEAKIAKMTLYKGFRTKDGLILETLRQRDTRMRNWFITQIEKASSDPTHRLLAYFDALESWCSQSDFNGCLFISALSEYSDESNPLYRAAKEHKRLFFEDMMGYCKQTDVADPESLAFELRILMEGATATELTLERTDNFQIAKRLATLVIESALASQGSRSEYSTQESHTD